LINFSINLLANEYFIDRRALGNNNRPVGVFVGHAEGVIRKEF
jgi:hypothetical protein